MRKPAMTSLGILPAVCGVIMLCVSEDRYRWLANVETVGGVVFVADEAEFGSWGGIDPDPPNGPHVVHYYGHLVEKLPGHLQPSGAAEWHQTKVVLGTRAAHDYYTEVVAAAKEIEPDLRLAADDKKWLDRATNLSQWCDRMEHGVRFLARRQQMLFIDAAPDTDYRRACAALNRVRGALMTFADTHTGVVWDMEGSGWGTVGTADDGFLLVRTWVDPERRYETVARQYAADATNAADETQIGIIDLPTGRVTLAWATWKRDELDEPQDVSHADLPMSHGITIDARPGRYRVTMGNVDDAAQEWSCRWIRFTRT